MKKCMQTFVVITNVCMQTFVIITNVCNLVFVNVLLQTTILVSICAVPRQSLNNWRVSRSTHSYVGVRACMHVVVCASQDPPRILPSSSDDLPRILPGSPHNPPRILA